MTDKLQKVKEALEKALCFINGYDMDSVSVEVNEALAELNSYIEARDSDEMVERVAKEIRQAFVMMECGVTDFEKALPIMARAAIKAMEAGE